MKFDDYIRGARRGREAHELEREAMRDPLLGDALDGVLETEGDHPAALERLRERLAARALARRGVADAQSRRRFRVWGVAVAAMLVGVIGGGVWLMLLPGDRTTDMLAYEAATAPEAAPVQEEAVQEDAVQERPQAQRLPEEMRLETRPSAKVVPADAMDTAVEMEVAEMADMAVEQVAAEPAAENAIVEQVLMDEAPAAEAALEAPAVMSAARAAMPVATRAAGAATAVAAGIAITRDTTTTAAFRKYMYDINIVRSARLGRVTATFEIDANGRPRNIETTAAATTSLGEAAATAAKQQIENGPDWPTEPKYKLITIEL